MRGHDRLPMLTLQAPSARCSLAIASELTNLPDSSARYACSTPAQCKVHRKKELLVPLGVKNVHWGYW